MARPGRTIGTLLAALLAVLVIASIGPVVWGPPASRAPPNVGPAPNGTSELLPGATGQDVPGGPSEPVASVPASELLGRASSSLESPKDGMLGSSRSRAALDELQTGLGGDPSYSLVEGTLRNVASGRVPASRAYLPSLQLLEHPVDAPAQVVSPTYTVSPAPMGIADFGLASSGAYSIATPGVLGQLNLTSYNATAGALYEVTGAGYWDGLGPNTNITPWQSGIQLNTVVTNVSYPGSNSGVFWTQNVLDISGSTLQFVDNVWNFSGSSGALLPGTLYSYNGTYVTDEFYYDSGPTIPLAFPLSIDLYNNASVRDDRTTLTFGYRITEGASVYTGIYDTVVFNSAPSAGLPLWSPAFKVDGRSLNPFGLLFDAELVFAGPGGGSNAAIDAVNGTMTLRYENGSSWSAPRATYDFGTDSGETAIGVATTWSGTTAEVVQGPSLLYGLWNTTHGVPSGRDRFSAQLEPTYGFAFLGPSGSAGANLSWVPSGSNGSLTTFLPPSVPPATSYSLTAFADGFAQLNLSFDLAFPPTYPVALSLTPSPGVWNAPIYLDGETQALAFEADALAETGASLNVSNLSVDVNLTFNHVNDFGFPEFVLLWAYQVSSPLTVDALRQGPDSPSGLTLYVVDAASKPYLDAPDLGSTIELWGGGDDVLANLTLTGVYSYSGVPLGGAVALWDCPDVVASALASYAGSFGVWAVQSSNVSVSDSTAVNDGVDLTTLNSANSSGHELSAADFAADVVDEGGSGGRFTDLSASFDGLGFVGEAANDSRVANSSGVDSFEVVEILNSTDDAVVNMSANGSLAGVEADGTVDLSIVGMAVQDATAAAVAVNSSGLRIADVMLAGGEVGVGLERCLDCSVANLTANGTQVGVVLAYVNGTTVSNLSATQNAFVPAGPAGPLLNAGIVALDANETRVQNASVRRYDAGLYALNSSALTVTGLSAGLGGSGVVLNGTRGADLASIACDDDLVGVELSGNARNDLLTSSSIVASSGYGVSILSGTGNVVTNNAFSANNGATTVYNPGRIQAFSVADNAFTNGTGVGNRWGDWHSYDGPHLAPYPIANGVSDLDPIGPLAYAASFSEVGLPSADAWAVSVGGTRTVVAPGETSVTVWEPNGSWTYVVNGPHGEVVSSGAATGLLAVNGSAPSVSVRFVAGRTASLTVARAGLLPGTSWCVELGSAACTTGRSLVFPDLTPGAYPYQVLTVGGYAVAVTEGREPVATAGSVTVGARGAHLQLSFRPVLYGVTFTEGGLPSAVPWHLTVTCTADHTPSGCGGLSEHAAVGTTTTTVLLRNGTYRWQVRPIHGYYLLVDGVVGWSGELTVSGAGGTVELAFYLGTPADDS